MAKGPNCKTAEEANANFTNGLTANAAQKWLDRATARASAQAAGAKPYHDQAKACSQEVYGKKLRGFPALAAYGNCMNQRAGGK